jgi:hypothetical protein
MISVERVREKGDVTKKRKKEGERNICTHRTRRRWD